MARTVVIDLRDFAGQAAGEHPSGRDKVMVWAPEFRASTQGGWTTGPLPRTFYFNGAPVRIPDVEPGQIVIQFHVRQLQGQDTFTVNVPAGSGEVRLAELMADAFEYDPPIISEAQRTLMSAREALNKATAAQEQVEKLTITTKADLRKSVGAAQGDIDKAVESGKESINRAVQTATTSWGKQLETMQGSISSLLKSTQTTTEQILKDHKAQVAKSQKIQQDMENVLDTISWSGDKLSVNGKQSPSLTGPRGPQGVKGATGDTGPQGEVGPQGKVGPVGPTGPKGDQGDRGERGPTGTVAPGEVVPLPKEVINLADKINTEDGEGKAILVVQGGTCYLSLEYQPNTIGIVYPIKKDAIPGEYRASMWVYNTASSTDDLDVCLVTVKGDSIRLEGVSNAGSLYRTSICWNHSKDVSAMSGPMGPRGPKGDTGASTWADVTGKPSTFPPSKHTHKMADISDMPNVDTGATGGAIVKRWGSGHITVPEVPDNDTVAASKKYVDTTAFPREVTSIKGAVDLDNFKETGVYHQSLDRDARSSTNHPSSRAGLLEVFNPEAGMTYQRYTDYGVRNNVWTRGLYSGNWSQWQKISQDGHKHTVADISDLPLIRQAVTDGTIVQRWSNGSIDVPDNPTSAQSATSKSYVDSVGNTKADKNHKHTMADISDLPEIANGSTSNSLVQRDTNGIFYAEAPKYKGHVANKGYVDSRIQVVSSLPSSPESDVLYVITE